LIQWRNVRARDRWAVSANCLRRFGPVWDIRFVKLVPHCVLLRTHDGRWCNGRWCRMVPTTDWQFNAGCAVRSLQLAATSCSLQHAQLYSCTHGRVLYIVLYRRIIQTFYTHSSIIVVLIILSLFYCPLSSLAIHIVLSFLPLSKHKLGIFKFKIVIRNLFFPKSNKISNILKVVSSFLPLFEHKWGVPSLKTPIPNPILTKGNKVLNI
jgi:hypothetical protein